jgi:hypothetical protein
MHGSKRRGSGVPRPWRSPPHIAAEAFPARGSADGRSASSSVSLLRKYYYRITLALGAGFVRPHNMNGC